MLIKIFLFTANSVNSLYLFINNAIGYIEENNGRKYLILISTDEMKDTLKKYEEIWSKIKDLIRSKSNKSNDYD